MKILCESCQATHQLEPPAWVVSSGRPFRFRCSTCGHSQMVQAPDPNAPPEIPEYDNAPLPPPTKPEDEQTTLVTAPRLPREDTDGPAAEDAPPPPSFQQTPFQGPGDPSFYDEPAPVKTEDLLDVESSPTLLPTNDDEERDASAVYLKQDGKVYMVRSWDMLRQWILEQRVSREDLVSDGGVRWSPVGSRPEATEAFTQAEASSNGGASIPHEETSETFGAGPLPFDSDIDAPFDEDSYVDQVESNTASGFPRDEDTDGVPLGLPRFDFVDGPPPASGASISDSSTTDEPAPPALWEDPDAPDEPAAPALWEDPDAPDEPAPPALLDEDEDEDEQEDDSAPVAATVEDDDPEATLPAPLPENLPASAEAPAEGFEPAYGEDEHTSGFDNQFFDGNKSSGITSDGSPPWLLIFSIALTVLVGGLLLLLLNPSDTTPEGAPASASIGDALPTGPAPRPPEPEAPEEPEEPEAPAPPAAADKPAPSSADGSASADASETPDGNNTEAPASEEPPAGATEAAPPKREPEISKPPTADKPVEPPPRPKIIKPAPEPEPMQPPIAGAVPKDTGVNVTSIVNSAWRATDKGNNELAANQFRQALRANPGSGQANYGYGYILTLLDRKDEAATYLCLAKEMELDLATSREVDGLLRRHQLECNPTQTR